MTNHHPPLVPAPSTSPTRSARDAALARLLEARAVFRDETEARYASGGRLSARDCDRLERIGLRLVDMVDELQGEFDRLDVARDLCAYRGADGLRIERAGWPRADIAFALAEAFESVLHPTGCAVLQAALRLETA